MRSVQLEASSFQIRTWLSLPLHYTTRRNNMEQQHRPYSIKIRHESTPTDTVIRKLTFNGRPSWEELSKLITARFQLNTEAVLALKYRDQDQDMITIVRLLMSWPHSTEEADFCHSVLASRSLVRRNGRRKQYQPAQDLGTTCTCPHLLCRLRLL